MHRHNVKLLNSTQTEGETGGNRGDAHVSGFLAGQRAHARERLFQTSHPTVNTTLGETGWIPGYRKRGVNVPGFSGFSNVRLLLYYRNLVTV